MIKRGLVWLFIGGLVIFQSPLPTFAAGSPGFDLTISPLPVNLTTTPGQTITTELRVQNSSTNPSTIHVSLLKFDAESDTGHPRLLDRAPGDTFFDWVSFSKNDFAAAPGQWTNLTMTIKPPKSAAFGYYYAVVFSNAKNNAPPSATNSASLKGAVASLVLLDVKAAGEKRQLQIASFTANKKYYEFLPANFTVKVKNTGNVHAQPSGSIFIKKGSKVIDTIDVNPTHGNILPKSTRSFTPSWNNGFPHYQVKLGANGAPILDKNGKPEQSLKWDFSKANRLRFGHYTAELVLVYDNGKNDVPIKATLSFWVIPWRVIGLLVGLVVLIAALVTYIIILRRRLKRAGSGHHKSRFGGPRL